MSDEQPNNVAPIPAPVMPILGQNGQGQNGTVPGPVPFAQAAEKVDNRQSPPFVAAPNARSWFVDERTSTSWAGKHEEDDGVGGKVVFYFDLLSPEVLEHFKKAPQQIAQELGVPYQQYVTDKKLMLSPAQSEIKERRETELQEAVIKDALRHWTLPRPRNEENIRKLHPDLKVNLSEAIVNLSRSGITGARFRTLLRSISAEAES